MFVEHFIWRQLVYFQPVYQAGRGSKNRLLVSAMNWTSCIKSIQQPLITVSILQGGYRRIGEYPPWHLADYQMCLTWRAPENSKKEEQDSEARSPCCPFLPSLCVLRWFPRPRNASVKFFSKLANSLVRNLFHLIRNFAKSRSGFSGYEVIYRTGRFECGFAARVSNCQFGWVPNPPVLFQILFGLNDSTEKVPIGIQYLMCTYRYTVPNVHAILE